MIPIAQGLVSIYRDPLRTSRDDYDTAPNWHLEGTVRAVIDGPSGSERTSRAEAETVRATMICDVPTFGLEHTDICRDWRGELWSFEWTQPSDGFGLDHMQVGLVRYDGAAPA